MLEAEPSNGHVVCYDISKRCEHRHSMGSKAGVVPEPLRASPNPMRICLELLVTVPPLESLVTVLPPPPTDATSSHVPFG